MISGYDGLMVHVVGSRRNLGYYGVLLQEVIHESLRYCNHNFYFVGSTIECNPGGIRVISWHYVSDSILFVSNEFIFIQTQMDGPMSVFIALATSGKG